MDAAIELRVLGPVEAAAPDGRPLRLGGPRQRALLALLLLEPARPLSTGMLAEELWQGSPPEGAGTTLRSYVSRLRRALGADAVAAQAGGYALRVDPEQVDAHRFERLVREGQEAAARGAAGLAAERLRAALALWRGPALQDVRDGGSLAREAHRLDELRLVCLEERIDADLALARHGALVPELQALVREEPLRERLRRQLVLALYRSGRQAEALEAYRETRRLLDEELGLEPGEELRELERAILRHEVAAVAPPEARHNLPAPTTSFVGRERELAELERLLRAHRLVTLTGMGGAGKTRLALEAGLRQAEAWADGVWLVDLTARADPELVPVAVAGALGVPDWTRERVLDALLEHARRRELLLVLDNCEHLVEACADVADALLRGCPNVRVLATSRVPLGLPGEHDVALDPLAEPAAVRLFLERAAAVRRGAPPAGEQETAAAICRELDGLPLAIELAAARAKALSLDDIAARLDDRFRFLRAWRRVADPRHRTLETTMDWSYGLLAPAEQELLRRLSVFAGGADLEAAAEVCLEGDEDAAVELLGRLVDASLVRAETAGATRYRLLETVRQYAAARLEDDPRADDVHRRHAEHYLRVAEDANLSVESLGRGPQRHERVLLEQHNLRAALDWAAGEDVELGLRLMLSLENFWITHAPDEASRRYERLLAQADGLDLSLRAAATRDHAAAHDVRDEWDRALALYERSGELARAAGDELAAAVATFRVGVVYYHVDRARVRELWNESLETFRAHGDRVGELQVLGNLGGLELEEGDRELGRRTIENGMAIAQEMGWVWWVTRCLFDLACDSLEHGDADDAEERARSALAAAWPTGNRQDALHAVAILARTAALRGDDERALALWASVEAVEDGPSRFGRFDRAAYAAAIPDGPRPAPLPLDEAVALALAG